jgi:hypothetical protein
MAYKIILPQRMMQDLWRLREYCAAPSIIQQVRESVAEYLKRKELEIGTSIKDVTEAIQEHRREEKMDQ